MLIFFISTSSHYHISTSFSFFIFHVLPFHSSGLQIRKNEIQAESLKEPSVGRRPTNRNAADTKP
jgi:hypothetical protein